MIDDKSCEVEIKNNLHFVSIEGNWDKDIQDKRIAHAAKILMEDEFSLAIASATCAPPSYTSFFKGRLGEYTKEMLINKYGIPAMRIIPAYRFPYGSTYTIIDAFTNAAVIGWVSCGLKRRNREINVLFEPSTSDFHGLRVETLNNRACQYLRNFKVNMEILCTNKLPLPILKKDYQEEAARLSEMQSTKGLIHTGEWLDNGKTRSFDDLNNMKHDLFETFRSVFQISFSDMDNYMLSDFGRVIFTLLWNQMANNQKLSDQDFKNVCAFVRSWFGVDLSETEIQTIKKMVMIRNFH
ncbi:hypothetical protein ACOAOT_05735 [Lacrimispora sp. AGF001]|uniref:hypothetical protein n=1 Tax=Lacrimispora sp. AGF001 TaxID=3401631 RepID=UPI003B430121|nr:hypothetical protein [Paenibacillaceae bacterium]